MLLCQKDRFVLPDGVHYLNCAYMAPLARAVRDAGVAGIDRRAAPHLIRPDDFFEESHRVRCLFSRLVNAPDANRIAILPAASYGLATVARNAPAAPGRTIVVVEEQFPSNVYTWRRLCEERQMALEVVEAPPPGPTGSRGAAWTARVLTAIDDATAVVALPHVHWADGTRFDLEQIGRRARACGAWLVIDGTQSVGAMGFDVRRVRPDALICAGYKWLLGPYSTGLAYYGPALDGGVPLEENWIARRGSEVFADLVRYRDEYQPAAIRYDVGERSNFTLLPMLAAALELVLAWTVPAIQAYCRSLTDALTPTLRDRGYLVETAAWRGAHLFGIRARPGADMATLADRLRERGVSVSVRGDAIRVSPHVYNDESDIEALLDALE